MKVCFGFQETLALEAAAADQEESFPCPLTEAKMEKIRREVDGLKSWSAKTACQVAEGNPKPKPDQDWLTIYM